MKNKTKENLQNLLKLVKELSSMDELEWFKKDLISFLIDNPDVNRIKSNENRENGEKDITRNVKNIERYLKIDGVKVIDYTKIKNERVRNQLLRDSIEMSKYRLGKFNDKVNFDEFCRYAYLQCEELINYYFSSNFNNDIILANNFIKKHWPGYLPPKSGKISAISMNAKSTGFLSEYGFKYTSLEKTLDFLRDFRNELSHRNSYVLKNEDNILSSLALKKIDVSSSFIDYKTSEKRDIELFNKGRFIYLKRKQDYTEIINALEILKDAVILILNR